MSDLFEAQAQPDASLIVADRTRMGRGVLTAQSPKQCGDCLTRTVELMSVPRGALLPNANEG